MANRCSFQASDTKPYRERFASLFRRIVHYYRRNPKETSTIVRSLWWQWRLSWERQAGGANDAAFFSRAIGRNDVRTHRANTMAARQALM